LFPNAETQFHVNYELTPPVQLITDSFGAIPIKTLTPSSNDSQQEQQLKLSAYLNDYNYHTWLDVNGDNFTSLAEFTPPIKQGSGLFTADFQQPFNNTNWNLLNDYQPFGYGPERNASYKQPFEAANIVILSDGTCASGLCSLFSISPEETE
jgi:hypothetical protein